MQAFSYDGIDTLIFHAYNPTIYICEDDYVVTGIDKTNTSYYLKVSEGKKVEVDIKINYADNLRPTDFDVTYIIKTSDGK